MYVKEEMLEEGVISQHLFQLVNGSADACILVRECRAFDLSFTTPSDPYQLSFKWMYRALDTCV